MIGILVGFHVGDYRVADGVFWGQQVLKLLGSWSSSRHCSCGLLKQFQVCKTLFLVLFCRLAPISLSVPRYTPKFMNRSVCVHVLEQNCLNLHSFLGCLGKFWVCRISRSYQQLPENSSLLLNFLKNLDYWESCWCNIHIIVSLYRNVFHPTGRTVT